MAGAAAAVVLLESHELDETGAAVLELVQDVSTAAAVDDSEELQDVLLEEAGAALALVGVEVG